MNQRLFRTEISILKEKGKSPSEVFYLWLHLTTERILGLIVLMTSVGRTGGCFRVRHNLLQLRNEMVMIL